MYSKNEGAYTSMAPVQARITSVRSIPSAYFISPSDSEVADSSVSSKDQLRTRVYSLFRDVVHVPLVLLLDL